MSQSAKEMDEILKSDRGLLITKQLLGTDFLQCVFKFVKAAEIHEPGNEIYIKIIEQMTRTAHDWLRSQSAEELILELKGEQFFINERRIRPRPKMLKKLKQLVQFLRSRHIFGFKIPATLKSSDLSAFLWILTGTQKGEATSQLMTKLKDQGLQGYEVFSVHLSQTHASGDTHSLVESVYQRLVQWVKDRLQNSQTPSTESLEKTLFELQSAEESELVACLCRNALRKIDFPPAHLAAQTAITLHGWGRALGLPAGIVAELSSLGLLHILALPPRQSELTEDRSLYLFRQIEKLKTVWPLTELQTLSLLEFSQPFGEQGVYSVNGQKCYQHFFSRMLRIAVIFQQLIIPGRGTQVLPPDQAIEKLLTENLGCDRSLVKLFVSWMGIYPAGSFVRLNTGEIGQVCSTSTDLSQTARPLVGIFKDREGKLLSEPTFMDMGEIANKVGVYKQGIQESLRFEDTGASSETLEQLTKMLVFSTS